VTGPSSPRGERAGKPGVTWETELRSLGEVVVPDDDGSPFGWAEPGANRETRRAARKRRRKPTP
jgi:hypothetical protein